MNLKLLLEKMPRIIYYTWGFTHRGADLTKEIKGHYFLSKNYKLGKRKDILIKIKYSFLDILQIIKMNPTVVIVDFASGFIKLIVGYMLKLFKNSKYVVDLHSAAYIDTTQQSFIVKWIEKLIIDRADLIILHNEESLTLERFSDKKTVVLESRVPEINLSEVSVNKSDTKIIVFITKFHADEPIENMLETTNLFSNNYEFYFTGNYKNYFNSQHVIKKNVTFTGFLPDDEYYKLLNSADVLIALTNREYTLVYGGREAISLNKPLIVSVNNSCKKYFNEGVLFTNNEPIDIANKIKIAIEKSKNLTNMMKLLKVEKNRLWEKRIITFKNMLKNI